VSVLTFENEEAALLIWFKKRTESEQDKGLRFNFENTMLRCWLLHHLLSV